MHSDNDTYVVIDRHTSLPSRATALSLLDKAKYRKLKTDGPPKVAIHHRIELQLQRPSFPTPHSDKGREFENALADNQAIAQKRV